MASLSLVTFPPKCIFFNSEAHQAASHIQTPSYFLFVYVNVSYPLPLSILSTLSAKIYHFFSGWQQLHCQPYAIAQMFNVPWSLTLPLSPSLQMVSVANGWTEPPVCDSATKQSGWPGKKNNSTKLQSDCLPKNQKDQFLTKYAQTNHSNF